MKVFAVMEKSWDGIAYIKLFKSLAKAKVHCRELNRKIGYKCYGIEEMEVEE